MKRHVHRIAAAALAASGLLAAGAARADITLYEHEGFAGRALTLQSAEGNLRRESFNDRASSIVVNGPRWARWEVCEDAGFRGRCVTLRSGSYPTLADVGLNDRISSAREITRDERGDRPEPMPTGQPDYRRRAGEQLWVVNVLDVRTVVETPQQRCWTERETVQERGAPNAGGAVVGAVLGGILGHQIGGGAGRDLATVGGVVGGAALGAQVGRNETRTQDVQRCRTVSEGTRPQYYDVSYEFRGREHHVQMTTAPGKTLLVNAEGEPRV